jgi:hypothetical protein
MKVQEKFYSILCKKESINFRIRKKSLIFASRNSVIKEKSITI